MILAGVQCPIHSVFFAEWVGVHETAFVPNLSVGWDEGKDLKPRFSREEPRVKIYLTNQENSVILSILGEQHERIQDFNRSNPPP